jgi:hypothetical protein
MAPAIASSPMCRGAINSGWAFLVAIGKFALKAIADCVNYLKKESLHGFD